MWTLDYVQVHGWLAIAGTVPQLLFKYLQIATKLSKTHPKLLLYTDVFSSLDYYSECFGFPAMGNLSVQVT